MVCMWHETKKKTFNETYIYFNSCENNIYCWPRVGNILCFWHKLEIRLRLVYFMYMTECLGTQIAKFMGPTWGPPGSCRPQMGSMLPHEPCYQGSSPLSNGPTILIHEKWYIIHEEWYIWYISFTIYHNSSHDDVIKWRHFPRHWPFVRGIHRPRWIPRTKASDAELWCILCSVSE